MAISKKLRFEVFKRDGFACQYCGRRPPLVSIEVDHIEPILEGGTDDIDNLTTACFDCNRGKAGEIIEDKPATLWAPFEFFLDGPINDPGDERGKMLRGIYGGPR